MGVIPAPKSTGLFKLALPYIALISFYFMYLFIGSLVYGALESSPEKETIKEIKQKENSLKSDIEQLFQNRSSSTHSKEEQEAVLKNLLDELVDTVSHPDWIPGRIELLDTPDVWGIPSAMLFCMTTITTIGYGDLVPTTDGGRWFTIFYSCLGVPLSFLLFAVIGGLLARLASRIAVFVRKHVCRRPRSRPPPATRPVSNGNLYPALGNVEAGTDNEVFEAGEGSGDQNGKRENIQMQALPRNGEQKKKPAPLQKQQSVFANIAEEDDAGDVPFLVVILLMISYVCVGAASFAFAEKWSYFEAFYFTFITLTTIGFGDYTPTHHFENGTHFPTLLYTLVGLCYISMCVTLLQTRFVQVVTKVGEKITGFVSARKSTTTDDS